MNMKQFRNFCIIAHIDHGKSTLADRLLEHTHTVTDREMMEQLLDSMDLERERGITIKSHAIQMNYQYNDEEYVLNLIDTPGHVDFSYEVSRSIAACEGALLIIDASQGIEAQTISNLYLALEHDLEIIPVLNKIDLPGAMVEEVKDEIVDLIGVERDDILLASAKEGVGIEGILNAIVEKIPPPKGDPDEPLQAMIFDSVYNSYRGVEVIFRVFNGTIRKGDRVKFVNTNRVYDADEIGILKLKQEAKGSIGAGNVGYLISGIKTAKEVKVGDTITHVANPTTHQVSGFEDVKPMVFAGIYPVDTDEYEELRTSIEKLQLNDASLVFEPESSAALGFGFRCGFLGLLHMEIIQERLEREFDLDIITTVPNVKYQVDEIGPEEITTRVIDNPSEMPNAGSIQEVREPFVKADIITPTEYIGNLMQLCQDRRGVYVNTHYLDEERVSLQYELPLAEIVFDFYDRLKSLSRGYASFDYEFLAYRTSQLAKMDILINGDAVDALSTIVHREKAYEMGRKLVRRLRELIPRQMFEVALQASLGNRIIARETVKAMRKDVTAKCYGGDITRKRKLLEKQKEGKRRMKQVGRVEVPQEAFLAVLSMED